MFSKQLEFYKSNFETQFYHLTHFFEKYRNPVLSLDMFYEDTILNDFENLSVD